MKEEVVIAPEGLTHGGNTYPPGTPVEELKGSEGHLHAWRQLKQIGVPAEAADAEETGSGDAASQAPKKGRGK